MSQDEIIKSAKEKGFQNASFIDASKILFDEGFRKNCEMNSCGNYGRNYACPPNAGEAGALIAKARKYRQALVFQSISPLEDSYDYEGMMDAQKKHAKAARSLWEEWKAELGPSLLLSAGECQICAKCGMIDGVPCRFPDKAVSSLEAYCIDVSQLAPVSHMKYINGTNTVTYFGAVLFDPAD